MFKFNLNEINHQNKSENFNILFKNNEKFEQNNVKIIEFLIDNRKTKFDKIQNHSNVVTFPLK